MISDDEARQMRRVSTAQVTRGDVAAILATARAVVETAAQVRETQARFTSSMNYMTVKLAAEQIEERGFRVTLLPSGTSDWTIWMEWA